MFGALLARKTVRRFALAGCRGFGAAPRGKKQITGFRLAANESASDWEKFLGNLYCRGLTGKGKGSA
jgi:hypothetical protein